LNAQFLGCIAIALARIGVVEKLDAGDAAVKGGKVEQDIFAELATLVELFLLEGFGVCGGRIGGCSIRRRSWREVQRCRNERARCEEAFGNALEGFLFDAEEARLVQFIFFALVQKLEGRHFCGWWMAIYRDV
jgi:hypothetical protein